MLEVLGIDAVQNYLIREVQRVYRVQGVDINDKHIEIIVRQMLKKVKVLDAVGAWRNIELADGRQGWISESDIEVI